MSPPGALPRSCSDIRAPLLDEHQNRLSDDDAIANPPGDDTSRQLRIAWDIGLLFGVLSMLLWPWTFFGIVNAKDGIEMSSFLSDIVRHYPQQVASFVAYIGTANQLVMTFLLSQIILRYGEELVKLDEVTVFRMSALSAFRYMTLVWGFAQRKGLTKAKRRLAVVLLFFLTLGASSLISPGTVGLLTPGTFNKTAELRGTELDFTSDDPGCLEWLERNQLTNFCGWKVSVNHVHASDNPIIDKFRIYIPSVLGVHNTRHVWGRIRCSTCSILEGQT
jgi:hypothetical protein